MTIEVQIYQPFNDIVLKLARDEGYTDKQIAFAKTFGWDATFNKSKLYVSEGMIRDHLGHTPGRSMMSDFYKIMSKQLIENMDYWELQYGSDELIEYFRSETILTGNTAPTHVNGKRYYVITGDAFKRLLMLSTTPKGMEARIYYLKTESLAMKMAQYLSQASKVLLESKVREADEKIADFERRNNILKDELIREKTKKEKNQIFYIISTETYAKKGNFKLGKTGASIRKRTSSMNTGHMSNDPELVFYEVKTHDSLDLERRIHRALDSIRVSDLKDFFHGPLDKLIEVIDSIANHQDEDNELVNTIIEEIIEIKQQANVDYLSGRTALTTLKPVKIKKTAPKKEAKPAEMVEDKKEEQKQIVVFDSLPEYRNAEYIIVVKAIKDHFRTTGADYDYDIDSRRKSIMVHWDNISPFILDHTGFTGLKGNARSKKLMAWKMVTRRLFMDYKPIMIIMLYK